MSRGPERDILYRVFDCVNTGIEWSTEQIKSACPFKRKKSLTDSTKIQKAPTEPHGPEHDGQSKKDAREDETSKYEDKSRYYIPASKFCPKPQPSCCYIKMQDPCAPCCCEKTHPPPCPPKSYPEPPREPMCSCDLCKERNADSKCCDGTATFRSATEPRYFEKA